LLILLFIIFVKKGGITIKITPFVSPAITFRNIRESVGFGLGGLGGILVVISLFEIVGLSILLYLSTE